MSETTQTQEVKTDDFVPSESPFGKRTKEQVGNNLFQDTVVSMYKAAAAQVKAAGPRVLTPSQQNALTKRRAKKKVEKASRKRNR